MNGKRNIAVTDLFGRKAQIALMKQFLNRTKNWVWFWNCSNKTVININDSQQRKMKCWKTYHESEDCEPHQFHYEAEETVTDSDMKILAFPWCSSAICNVFWRDILVMLPMSDFLWSLHTQFFLISFLHSYNFFKIN